MERPISAEWFKRIKTPLDADTVGYYSQVRATTANLDEGRHFCPLCKCVQDVKEHSDGDVTCSKCSAIVTNTRLTDSAEIDISAVGGVEQEHGARAERQLDTEIAQWLGIEYIPSTSFYVPRNHRGTKIVAAMMKSREERFIDRLVHGIKMIEKLQASRLIIGKVKRMSILLWIHFSIDLTGKHDEKKKDQADEKSLYVKPSRIAACVFLASQYSEQPFFLAEAAYMNDVHSKKPKKTVLRVVKELVRSSTTDENVPPLPSLQSRINSYANRMLDELDLHGQVRGITLQNVSFYCKTQETKDLQGNIINRHAFHTAPNVAAACIFVAAQLTQYERTDRPIITNAVICNRFGFVPGTLTRLSRRMKQLRKQFKHLLIRSPKSKGGLTRRNAGASKTSWSRRKQPQQETATRCLPRQKTTALP